MNCPHQIVVIASSLLASWLGMQAVHELGHVLGAWLTGGRVERVVLHPLAISRTDLAENPRPLVVAWAGPALGVAVPLLVFLAVEMSMTRCGAQERFARSRWFLRFFAGFCLLANGLYLGVGSLTGVGDCGDLLMHGSKPWQLWLFGLATAPLGLLLWHGLGPQLGLGASKPNASPP
jgi:peptidase M50B-like protein